jgi:hypothetical protein
MTDNSSKDVVGPVVAYFGVLPQHSHGRTEESNESIPAEARTKYLPEESQKFYLLNQCPRRSKSPRISLATYELKNRKKRIVYMTLNIRNVELKGKICFKEHHVYHWYLHLH